MIFPIFQKPVARRLVPWIVAAIIIALIAAYYGISQFGSSDKSASSSAEKTPPPVTKVTALGRLEPAAQLIRLSTPLALNNDRIAQLRVEEGDQVKAGQVIAILDSQDRLQAALAEAQKQVRVAQSRLAQVKAGAKVGEIQAQKATIARLQAELQGETATQRAATARWQAEVQNAKAEYQRFEQLYQQGAVSTSSLDSKRLAAQTAQAQFNEASARQNRVQGTLPQQIKEAQATLDRIAEVRPVDIRVAQADLERSLAALRQAKINAEQSYVRAPIDGQILKIRARRGETIREAGIADFGQTNHMIAVAEVYQTDIGKIKLGQPAVITGDAFSGKLEGTVSQIGLQVSKQNVFSNQPGENLDRRVVEVKIRLNPEDSKRVAGLTNLQVQTAINL
jgi:HlyD family secretion protein